MKKKHIKHHLALIIAALWAFPTFAMIQTQYSENFDTNWPGAPWALNKYSNVVNTVSGWSIISNSIATVTGYFTTPSNACFFAKGNSATLTSPLLTNGIGAVIYDAKNSSASIEVILTLESSYNGSSWFTNSVTTNFGSPLLTSYTNIINSYSNQYFRVRRIDNNSPTFAIDTVRITYPTAVVTISDPITTPLRPTDQDPVTLSANISVQSVPDTLAMTNYWREWPATNWTLYAMTSNSPTLYIASSNVPAKTIGARVEYFARATFISDGISYTTNSSTNAYVVIPKSSYTNLAVIGQVDAPLRNGANYQWQSVIQVTNSNPTFNFQGISNANTTTWGELNQSVTNTPLYGQVEIATNNIKLYTTNNGYYLFSFHETNLTDNYTVRSCTYENFNTWTAATFNAFSTYTNNGWVLTSGNTSNDTPRILDGIGRSAVIETNGWLRSPQFTNGIGQLSFWYRNWQTTGSPIGKFQIQTSSNGIDWASIGSGISSDIVSTNYLFFSALVSDIASTYVRILNTNTSARLCLDEIAIVSPGAVVVAANLGTIPSPTATILDPISIIIDLTPYNGASLGDVTAWYRLGSNSVWIQGAMTSTDGIHYALSPAITGAPLGELQYAVQYSYSGFQASIGYIFSPMNGTNNPAVLNVNEPVNNRQENFDTNWPGAPWALNKYSNVVNTVSGWSIISNSIATATGYFTTPSNACFFAKGNSATLTSPLLTNGIGAVIYDAKNSAASIEVILTLESSYNGSSWFTNSVTTNFGSTLLTSYTNIINSYSNQYFRVRRIDNNSPTFAIDTVRITYPPANVAITNIYHTPSYPVAGQSFVVSCDIASINPIFPAYNLTTPIFYYWTGDSAPTPVPMAPDGISGIMTGVMHFHTPSITLGTDARDKTYNYYISTTFEGYSASNAERQSPKKSITNTFGVRAYASDYQNIAVTVNGSNSTARLLTNNIWQTIFNVANTNSSLSLALQGYGYSTGLGISASTVTWGNSNNWQTTLPLADYAGSDQTNITLTGGTFFGQYLVRFNESTLEYFVLPCVWQDFDGWTATNAFTLTGNSGLPSIDCDFNDWPTNQTRVRFENFAGAYWNDYTNSYTSGTTPNPEGTDPFYLIYGTRVANAGGAQGYVAQIQSNNLGVLNKRGWIAQQSTSSLQNFPLRGIGTISYKYRAATSNPPCTLGVYLFPTNEYLSASSYYDYPTKWANLATHTLVTNPSNNTSFTKGSISVNTNITSMVLFSHDDGDQSVYFDDLSVSEWYADTKTNATSWIAYESWIETRLGGGNTCRFDPTRSTKTEQYLRTPLLPNGMDTIDFNYCSGNNTAGRSITNTFEGWSTNIYGNYTYMDWTFINGRTASNNAYAQNSTNSAWLNGAPGNTNTSLTSPELVNGARVVTFAYRNWTTNGSPVAVLQVQGASSATPWIWTPISTLPTPTNSTNYFTFTTNFVTPNYNFIRILNNPYGSNAPACIDNITIDEAPATLAGRYVTNSFESWTNAAYGNYAYSNWVLTAGRSAIDSTRAHGGNIAAWLSGTGTPGGTNSSLRSPYLNFGFQGVEFWYRNWETNASPTGKFLVQVAPTDTPASWVTIDTISSISSSNYVKYTYTTASLTNHYMRIVNNPDGDAAAICIDDITIEDFPCVNFDIQISTNSSTWSTLSTVAKSFKGGSITDYVPYTLYAPTNLSMYVRIFSKTPAPNILLIDDVSITQFSRGENWVANNVKIDKTPASSRLFVGGAGYLNSNRTSEVDTLVDTNSFPYIQSPPLAAGIGEISFWYRNWAISGTPAPTRLAIQKSSDSAIWNTVWELPVESATNTADYRYFTGSLYDTNSHYIRIINNDTDTPPVGRVCIDNILVTTPMASSLTLSNLVILPGIPLYSDTVKVAVEASRLFLIAPSNLTLTTKYGTGSTYTAMSSAGFATAPMTCVYTNLATKPRTYRYETTTGIPAMQADTFVKYEARASFSGYHPEVFSPTTNKTLTVAPTWYAPLPSTGMAYYVVYSCPTGSVWINEVNYGYTSSDKTNEFVELCGVDGSDIRSWSIFLANLNTNIYGIYTITNQNAFGNVTNGYGFWILGDSNVANRSMIFTNAESVQKHLYEPGGIRLTRPCGAYVDSVCYGNGSITTLTNAGYKYIGKETGIFLNPGSSLYQTGTVGAFTWVYTTTAGNHNTPGQINESQWFPETITGTNPPIISIVAFWINTNVWIECTSTNSWPPYPLYSINLLNTNGWSNVTSTVWSTYPALSASNTFTLNFVPPTNSPIFFGVAATNSP